MASRDLPAMLTHVLMATCAPHIHYVGHSQGTTIGMGFLSHHADSALAERIKVGGHSVLCWLVLPLLWYDM
jgi:pimeloyl-ACP methyl ester carboxylesterase